MLFIVKVREISAKAKMSETSLFAELVKDRNMRELAMKRLQELTEKKDEVNSTPVTTKVASVDETDSGGIVGDKKEALDPKAPPLPPPDKRTSLTPPLLNPAPPLPSTGTEIRHFICTFLFVPYIDASHSVCYLKHIFP